MHYLVDIVNFSRLEDEVSSSRVDRMPNKTDIKCPDKDNSYIKMRKILHKFKEKVKITAMRCISCPPVSPILQYFLHYAVLLRSKNRYQL